jgi:hypothetical protein
MKSRVVFVTAMLGQSALWCGWCPTKRLIDTPLVPPNVAAAADYLHVTACDSAAYARELHTLMLDDARPPLNVATGEARLWWEQYVDTLARGRAP